MTERLAIDWGGMFDAPGPDIDPCCLPVDITPTQPPPPMTKGQAQRIALDALRKAPDRFLHDDRRWCTDCQRLTQQGRCTAPVAGLLVASRQYEPSQTMPRRCIAYLPRPNDPDQSAGAVRWPWLKDAL